VNYSIRFHQDGHASAIRPEVEIAGYDRSGEMTVHLIWSVADDRNVRFVIHEVSACETAIKLLEAFLRAESMWDDRHSMRGIAGLWDHLEEVESSYELAEQIEQHQALTGGGFVL
jgi:hypothetical protein